MLPRCIKHRGKFVLGNPKTIKKKIDQCESATSLYTYCSHRKTKKKKKIEYWRKIRSWNGINDGKCIQNSDWETEEKTYIQNERHATTFVFEHFRFHFIFMELCNLILRGSFMVCMENTHGPMVRSCNRLLAGFLVDLLFVAQVGLRK